MNLYCADWRDNRATKTAEQQLFALAKSAPHPAIQPPTRHDIFERARTNALMRVRKCAHAHMSVSARTCAFVHTRARAKGRLPACRFPPRPSASRHDRARSTMPIMGTQAPVSRVWRSLWLLVDRGRGQLLLIPSDGRAMFIHCDFHARTLLPAPEAALWSAWRRDTIGSVHSNLSKTS